MLFDNVVFGVYGIIINDIFIDEFNVMVCYVVDCLVMIVGVCSVVICVFVN